MYIKPSKDFFVDPKTIPPPKVLAGGKKVVTDEQRAFMKKLYTEDGLSTWRIAKVMGYLNVCIINNLKRAGVQLRSRSNAAKTFQVNRSYFEQIDTHTKAYLLGLFYADGNIHKDSFTIALQEPDKYLLEALSKELGMTGSLGFRPKKGPKRKNMWALRIYDVEFCDNLRKWGVVPRKTSNLEFPKFLDEKFTYSFLHGLLDGDGCVYISKNHQIRAVIAGAPQITLDIQEILLNKFDINASRQTINGSRGTMIRLDGVKAIKFLGNMYRESKSTMFLFRKKEKFTDFIRHRVNPINNASERIAKACQEVSL